MLVAPANRELTSLHCVTPLGFNYTQNSSVGGRQFDDSDSAAAVTVGWGSIDMDRMVHPCRCGGLRVNSLLR